MKNAILGISAYYHDSAAALLVDGRIAAAVQEERFIRRKHYQGFPSRAVDYVLSEAGLTITDLRAIVYYEKPFLKFERLLETFHIEAPRGLKAFHATIPVWIRQKLFLRSVIWRELDALCGGKIRTRPELLFTEHHLAHAASAYYPSPFDNAAILTIDGVGEWATCTIAHGENESITILRELHFPHSLGLLYSAFTWYCGFRVNSGEYKLMGLAPYGRKGSHEVKKYTELIQSEMVDIRDDGSFLLNLDYFPYTHRQSMVDDVRWRKLFGVGRRCESDEPAQPHMDLALAIQQVTEEIVLRLARTARDLTGCEALALAGGVALNCVANARLVHAGIFKKLWIQPAAGDAGGALGAACAASALAGMRTKGTDGAIARKSTMTTPFLGPCFSDGRIRSSLTACGAPYHAVGSSDELYEKTASLLADGKVVGWFQGRMEWGPRALGNRSILADPRDAGMQKRLNFKIKFREGFRPFAPAIPIEEAQDYFAIEFDSPYMLLVAPVVEKRRKPLPADFDSWDLYQRLYTPRSDIPVVTHLDYSARLQTVHRDTNPEFHALLGAFKRLTGCPVLVNTSFNVRGEPIVCTPEDAYRCFMRTEMDYLVLGNSILDKKEQSPLAKDIERTKHFVD